MKLLTALTLAACFAILPSCVTAKEIWTKGDKVSVFFICREEEDRVVVRRTQSANNVDDIKVAMKNSVSKTLGNYLDQTDWIVIREQDNGTAKPADLAKWRTDLRAKAAALETSIDNKSDVASLEAMTIVTSEMAEKKENAEFHDWPVNPRESAV